MNEVKVGPPLRKLSGSAHGACLHLWTDPLFNWLDCVSTVRPAFSDKTGRPIEHGVLRCPGQPGVRHNMWVKIRNNFGFELQV